MQISKTVPVVIEVNDDNPNKCSNGCTQLQDAYWCARFEFAPCKCNYERHTTCLTEFGTGEKPNVVSWEESKAGDIVEVKNQLYVINYSKSPRDACEKCCLHDIPYCKGETEDSWCCYDHPSGCHVYFTEVEESPKQPPNP